MRHGAEILATYLNEHDPDTLISYAEKLGNGAVFKRLGFTLEALGTNLPDIDQACRDRATAGLSALDPDAPSGGKVLTRWGLRPPLDDIISALTAARDEAPTRSGPVRGRGAGPP